MEIEVRTGLKATTVVVVGDVDAATASALLEAGLNALTASGNVRLDLSGVGFMDSSGVAAVVDIWNRAASTEGTLILTNPSRAVQRVLRITGLTQIFTIDDAPTPD